MLDASSQPPVRVHLLGILHRVNMHIREQHQCELFAILVLILRYQRPHFVTPSQVATAANPF